MIQILSWQGGYEIFQQFFLLFRQKFKNTCFCAHVGNDRSGKWNVPQNPLGHTLTTIHAFEESSFLLFLQACWVAWAQSFMVEVPWASFLLSDTFFSLHDSACQILFLGLSRVYQAVIRHLGEFFFVLSFERFSLLHLSLKNSQWFLDPVYWWNISQYCPAADAPCNVIYDAVQKSIYLMALSHSSS